MLSFQIKLKTLLICFSALFCVMLAAKNPPKRAPEKPAEFVAIFYPVSNRELSDIIKSIVSSTIEAEVKRKYRIVDRMRTDELLKSKRWGADGLVDRQKAVELGGMLEADIVCSSSLIWGDSGDIHFSCALIDNAGEVLGSGNELIESHSNAAIKSGVEHAALEMLGKVVKITSPPSPNPPPVIISSGDPYPYAEQDVKDARETILKLKSKFNIKTDNKRGVSAESKYLSGHEKSQKDINGWYSLFVHIDDNRLKACSRWTYKTPATKKTPTWPWEAQSGKGDNQFAINHNVLSVTVDGETITVPLALKIKKPVRVDTDILIGTARTTIGDTILSKGNNKNTSQPSGFGLQEITIEEGSNEDDFEYLLRAIAKSRRREGLIKGFIRGAERQKEIVLNESIQEGITQTLNLYDAMCVLREAGMNTKEINALFK